MSQLIVFDGKGVDPERQTKPHIHCVEFFPDGKYVFATDSDTDNIYQFEINYDCEECKKDLVINKSVETIKVPDGSGPRHIVFHPNGKYLYPVNELSDTVSEEASFVTCAVYGVDGGMQTVQIIKYRRDMPWNTILYAAILYIL